jgi:hypothetical protein
MQPKKKRMIILTLLVFIFCPTILLATAIPPWQPDHYNDWTRPIAENGNYYFPLENWFNPNGVKNLWIYIEYSGSTEMFPGLEIMSSPPAKITFGPIESTYIPGTFYPGMGTFTETFILIPQPYWESIMVHPDGDQLITYAAMASKCTVPIPGAIWLFGAGLMGLTAMRKKFKK